MKFPHPSDESKKIFRAVLPPDANITVKPMFGNLASFVNGNMFAGLFGDNLFIRLSGRDRAELLGLSGSSLFEPMKGRQMKDYVVVPKSWFERPDKVKPWIARSLAVVSELPRKK